MHNTLIALESIERVCVACLGSASSAFEYGSKWQVVLYLVIVVVIVSVVVVMVVVLLL